MNIVYASDDNFADIMGVSIVSLLENNKAEKEIDIAVLDDHISEKNREMLNGLVESYRRKLVLIPVPDINKLAGVKIDSQRWSLSTFSRLFLPFIMPEAVDRVLYIDCDTIVRGPLKAFYGEDIERYYAAGVLDCISKGHRKNIGLEPIYNYFNAGILLINLQKWRENSIHDRFIDFIISYNGKLPYVDQGVINGVIGEEMKIVPPIYNSMTVGFDFQSYRELCRYRKPSKYYTEHEYARSITSPVIVHFTTSFLSLRPWVEGCKHPYTKEWQRYKALTPWKDKPPRKDTRSLKKKVFVWGYRMLPEFISIRIAGWLHAVAVPWMRGIIP